MTELAPIVAASLGSVEVSLADDSGGWADVPFPDAANPAGAGSDRDFAEMDLVVPGVAPGDLIEIVPSFVVDVPAAATVGITFSIVAIVAGAEGSRMPLAGLFGYTGWLLDSTEGLHPITAPALFKVAAGDIERGAVRLRLQYLRAADSGTACAIDGSGILAAPTFLMAKGPFKPRPGVKVCFEGQSQVFSGADAGGKLPDLVADRLIADGIQAVVTSFAQGATSYDDRATGRNYRYRAAAMSHQTTILVQWGGTNDLDSDADNQSAADTMTDMENSADLARTEGIDVVVQMTNLPATTYSAGDETKRQALNALILADANGKFDAVVDCSKAPELTDELNATYFPDGLHISSAGAAIAADLVFAKIAQFARGAIPAVPV